MLDTSYADYRETVYRQERMPEHYSKIINDPNVSIAAAALHLWMVDKPRRWRFLVAHIITVRNANGKQRFGGRDKVRSLLRELVEAGYVVVDRKGREGGGIEPGIYMVADSPGFFDEDAENKAPCFQAQCIKSNIDNIYTLRAKCGKPEQPCQQLEAEQPQAAAKTLETNQAEPRPSAASHLPEAEQPQAAARGSAEQKETKSAATVRYIERLRSRLMEAGGDALADPRRTPGLWRLTEITVWLALGYSLEDDILPVIRNVCTRYGGDPGRVVSWRYFSAAIKEAHAQRTKARGGVPSGKRKAAYDDPYRDPYAQQPAEPGGWKQAGLPGWGLDART